VTPLPELLSLGVSTLVSEDLASISAGLLARAGRVSLAEAAVACAAGVYVGDLGLWCLGRTFGRRLLSWAWLSSGLPGDLQLLARQIDTHLGATVMFSRVVPGSRLPVYVAAGIWGNRPVAFAVWSLLAVGVWTPALVAASALIGARAGVLLGGVQSGVATACAVGGLFIGLRVVGRVASKVLRPLEHGQGSTRTAPRDGKPVAGVGHRRGSLLEST